MWAVIDGDKYLCAMIQQSSATIWAVIWKLQRTNHAVMEIWNLRALNYNSNKYIYTSISMEKGVRFWLPLKTLYESTISLAFT